MIPLYDAHNHLQDERLSPALESILTELPALGLQCCVVNGTSEQDWSHVEALAKRCPWITPAFGLHPWFVKDRSSTWFGTLRRFLDANPGACIGEIGLDRWIHNYDIADQEKVFTAQLQLAAERNVAASVHCLKAWGHLNDVLQTNPRPARGFLLHSYGGSAELVPTFVKLGGYFSISGYFAHERKAAQLEVFKKISLERLLVETDAPDMLPPPELIAIAGDDINDPRNLPKIYEFAAKLFNMPLEDFAARMATNFNSLFC
jgi:TatD DNase family protein